MDNHSALFCLFDRAYWFFDLVSNLNVPLIFNSNIHFQKNSYLHMKIQLVKGKDIWIEEAYNVFAFEGHRAIKIEILAKRIGKSKSSFYHFFADLNLFLEELCLYHVQRASEIAKNATVLPKDSKALIHFLLSVKNDIFFQRELRVHRQQPLFEKTITDSHKQVENALLPVFAKAIGLEQDLFAAKMILHLTIENFYLQVQPNSFNVKWLMQYLNNLQNTVKLLRN